MALYNGNLGIAFEDQPVSGVLAPGLFTIVDSTQPGTITDAQGAVFGNAEAGIVGSGIDINWARDARGPATVVGSLTRKFDEFLKLDLASFSFSWPAAGPKSNTTPVTPVDADFRFLVNFGIDSLLKSGGVIANAGSGTPGFLYNAGDTIPISAVIWEGDPDVPATGFAYALVDLLCNLELTLTPGGAGIWVATFTGKPDVANSQAYAFPIFDFGAQDTVAAPNVESVANAYPVGIVRGWSDNVITIDNGIEEVPDSNALNGARIEQSQRDVTSAITLDSDSADPFHDWDNLTATIAETESIIFTVGTPADSGGGTPAVAYKVTFSNVNTQDYALAVPARSMAKTMTLRATANAEGAELLFETL